jgi:peptidoglycan/xylan/chitin deacetylase (PgdA/CDA1 family)
MSSRASNRAVSALFRVFGGAEEIRSAEAHERPRWQGMHLGEHRVFSILIPFTVFIAVSDGLSKLLGYPSGWLLAIPATFFGLSILPFVFQVRAPLSQWRMWSFICLIWAIFNCQHLGLAGCFSYLWIGIMLLNAAADGIYIFQKLMGLPGKQGVCWRGSLVIFLHAVACFLGVNFGWGWGISAGAIIAGVWGWAVFNPGCQWLGPVYRTTAENQVLITIDDGPDPEDTVLLLDLLDLHATKGIFFMIGEKILAHPELAREIVRRGHEIGNHTMTHPQASFWAAGPWRTWREISGCQRVIEDITGKKPRWFRAPVGHRNLFTHPAVGALGLQVMAWNRRGYDAVETDVKKVIARILPQLVAGDILLLHQATPVSVEILKRVLEHLAKRNDRQADRVT